MVQLRSFTVRAAGSGNLYRNGPLFVGFMVFVLWGTKWGIDIEVMDCPHGP